MKSWNSILCTLFVLLVQGQSFSQERLLASQSNSKDPAAGFWEWTMSMGLMRKNLSMEVIEREGKLVALVVTPEGKKIESKDFIRKDDRIQFTIRNEEGGKAMTVAHDGKLKGDKISGTAKMSGGPFDMSIKWDASRVVKKQTSPR